MQAVELNRSDMSHKLVCGLDLFFNQLHLIFKFFYVASVTLTEENYSGVRGAIQLVQNVESDHVMIVGALTGLSPGIHGIHVQPGRTCLDAVSFDHSVCKIRSFKLVLLI